MGTEDEETIPVEGTDWHPTKKMTPMPSKNFRINRSFHPNQKENFEKRLSGKNKKIFDFNNEVRYYRFAMIKSFDCKETEKIFHRTISQKLPLDIQNTALRKLWMMDAAENINDLRIPPSNHLEKLHGSENQYSIRINKQWRICFHWKNNDASDVRITDYH